MTQQSIRRATERDADLLAELGARTFYESFAAQNTPENMTAYLAATFGPEQQRAELADPRSEEHTSELQSRLHLVCRLLLEKKKKKKKKNNHKKKENEYRTLDVHNTKQV